MKNWQKSVDPKILDGIRRVRAGQIQIEPGYDGVYGKVRIFDDNIKTVAQNNQATLF